MKFLLSIVAIAKKRWEFLLLAFLFIGDVLHGCFPIVAKEKILFIPGIYCVYDPKYFKSPGVADSPCGTVRGGYDPGTGETGSWSPEDYFVIVLPQRVKFDRERVIRYELFIYFFPVLLIIYFRRLILEIIGENN